MLVVGHNPGLSDLATVIDARGTGLAPADALRLDLDTDDWRLIDACPVLRRDLFRAP